MNLSKTHTNATDPHAPVTPDKTATNTTGSNAPLPGKASPLPPHPPADFARRHIGPSKQDTQTMLKTLNCKSLSDLITQCAPEEIQTLKPLRLPPTLNETQCLSALKKLSAQNQIFTNYIGQGYHPTITPPVIERNILQNPVWLTPYTPYQSEISQGRLTALLNFQTMITEITHLHTANASLLDEGTATAEAVSIAFNNRARETANTVFIDTHLFPQTTAVLKNRAKSLGLTVTQGPAQNFDFNKKFFCAVIQYPNSNGAVHDWQPFCKKAQAQGIITVFTSELLSLCLLNPPGAMGADIVTGSCQRMGLPLFFGGPHSAYIAVKEQYTRSLPGRIVGVSKDRHGNPALRLALQTREQHIRRERATSNICTAQALPAVLASMYAVYHGPQGLKQIAHRVHLMALSLRESLKQLNFKVVGTQNIFDTVQVELPKHTGQIIYKKLLQHKINAGISAPTDTHTTTPTSTTTSIDTDANADAITPTNAPSKENQKTTTGENTSASNTLLSFSLNETTTIKDLQQIVHLFKTTADKSHTRFPADTAELAKLKTSSHPSQKNNHTASANPLIKEVTHSPLPSTLLRSAPCLKHPVFQSYHSETQLLRYIHKLQEGDLSLTHSMIPLGSCTMKLNGTTELTPVTWPGFANIHPFAPRPQTQGYQALIKELEQYLCEITGFSAVSFQPNAGSQGEYAGLLIIRKYHEERKDLHRKICLIPSSAHGTNPASAVMAGLTPVTIKCDQQGNISHQDLQEKLQTHKKNLAGFMLTFPSTFGVFEQHIPKICDQVHKAGGLVYLDGANMNALIGISRPAEWGADLCHLNLHKTFCIPHGGGGPGVGPVAVTKKLQKFLPSHPLDPQCGPTTTGIPPVSSAPYGSAGILMISWAYIRLMGAQGLTKATQIAILNANYMAQKLSAHYKILYTNKNQKVAHECILDFRKFKNSAEITVDDVAKRLIDYGFHAPTMSWPVPGTMMAEPTESENKQEIDRFCDALIEIRKEIKEIEDKKFNTKNNVLKNAPHTMQDALQEKWPFPYTKQKAFYPMPQVKEHKFWPTVSRVQNAYGDINLFCSCPRVPRGE